MLIALQLIQILLGLWMWTLIGRAVLRLLIRDRAGRNPVYQVMTWLCWPVLAPVRRLLPDSVPESHLGFYALFALLLLRVLVYMLFFQQGWLGDLPGTPP